MGFTIQGTIVQALPIHSGVSQSGTQWQRQSYIIEHEHGQYPKTMVFDVSGQKIQELAIAVGEEVKVYLNCNVREYPQGSGKFFNSIDAWKVERIGTQQMAPQPQYQPAPKSYAPAGWQPAPQPIPPQAPAPQPQAGGLPFPKQ